MIVAFSLQHLRDKVLYKTLCSKLVKKKNYFLETSKLGGNSNVQFWILLN